MKAATLCNPRATEHEPLKFTDVEEPKIGKEEVLFTTSMNQGEGEMDFSSVTLTMQNLNGIKPIA